MVEVSKAKHLSVIKNETKRTNIIEIVLANLFTCIQLYLKFIYIIVTPLGAAGRPANAERASPFP